MALFFKVPRGTGTLGACTKCGHIIIFFSKNASKKLQKSLKVHRFIYTYMHMTGDSQLCLCWIKTLHTFWRCVFFKLYILTLYLKPSIHWQLNIPTSKRVLKIVYFISNYWNIMVVSNFLTSYLFLVSGKNVFFSFFLFFFLSNKCGTSCSLEIATKMSHTWSKILRHFVIKLGKCSEYYLVSKKQFLQQR